MENDNNPNRGSTANSYRIDTEHPLRFACECIVAYDIMERNPDDLGVALRNPQRILEFPQGSTSASARLDVMVAAGAITEQDADELKALGRIAAQSGELKPTDPVFYMARHIAARAVTEEASSGVPGLWAAFVAVAEALRPPSRNAGVKSHG